LVDGGKERRCRPLRRIVSHHDPSGR
jgi:hypothetical protein